MGEAAVVDTFATYHPAKVFLGKPHPDPVVETSALAVSHTIPLSYSAFVQVAQPLELTPLRSAQCQLPPDVAGTVKLALPRDVIDEGFLSRIQLETIFYANR